MKARLLALAVLALTLDAGTASAARSGVRQVAPEVLLATDVSWANVQAVAGKGFWPQLPSFNSIIDEEDPQPLAAIAQTFAQPGGKVSIVTRLYAYASSEKALEFLQSNAIVVGQIDQKTPAVGDQHFYFVTSLADGSPSTRLFFIRGPVGVEIQVDNARWSTDRIGRLAAPVDQNIQRLVAGTLKAPALPAVQVSALPAASAAPGPVLGTASVPAEAWAMGVHKGSPQSIRNGLVKSGNATLPFRRYLRRGSNTDVVEVALFSFASHAAAQAWYAPFAAGVQRHPADRLDAGTTGSLSTYRSQLSNYELQFVSGRYVADVFCWAPFVATASTGCEAATRTLAESWYSQLTR